MMLFFFFQKIFAAPLFPNYVEIGDQNKETYLKGEKPILVKFYSPNCDACQEMEEPFNQASQYFDNVLFGGVNCVKEGTICEEEKIFGTPTVKLYNSYPKKDTIEYIGDRSIDSFIDFIEGNTFVQSFRPPQPLRNLNPITFQEFISRPYCNLVKFYHPPCNFIPVLKKIAKAFEAEQNVSFGIVNCEKFSNICEKNADAQIILYRNGRRILFNRKSKESIETEKKVVSFINRRCGTERGIDGLLVDAAGLIKEANKVAKEFVKLYTKNFSKIISLADDAIVKMKNIDGADAYVDALERMKKNGFQKFQMEVQKMFDVMDRKEDSQNVLDAMKRKYNVMIQLLPKSAIPFRKNDDDEEL